MSKLNDGITEDWYEQNRKQRLAGMQRDFRLSRADDDLSRGGDPLGLAISIVLCVAVTVMMVVGAITAVRLAQERTIAPDTTHIVAS